MTEYTDADRWRACVLYGFPRLTLSGLTGDLYFSMPHPKLDDNYPGVNEAADAAIDLMRKDEQRKARRKELRKARR